MTEQPPPPITFDAPAGPEAAPRTATCAACGSEIAGEYYTVNGHVTCGGCKAMLAAHGAGRAGLRGVLTAIGLGSAGGLAGAIAWWAIRRYASIEIGLIAIAIGHVVGLGVRRGSGGRGGRGYQVLAVLLTYFWITANYVPDIVQDLVARDDTGQVGIAVGSDASPTPEVVVPSSAGALVIAVSVLLAIALAAPFLQGVENIIGLLIISFGLWQAWTLNAARPLAVAGPFRLGATAPSPAVPPAPAPITGP